MQIRRDVAITKSMQDAVRGVNPLVSRILMRIVDTLVVLQNVNVVRDTIAIREDVFQEINALD